MKKVLSLALVLMLGLAVSGCTSSKAPVTEPAPAADESMTDDQAAGDAMMQDAVLDNGEAAEGEKMMEGEKGSADDSMMEGNETPTGDVMGI